MIAHNVCSWGRVARQGAFSFMRPFTRVCARVTRDIKKTRHNAPRALRVFSEKRITTRHPIRRALSPGGATGIVSSELPLGMARSSSILIPPVPVSRSGGTGEGPHRHVLPRAWWCGPSPRPDGRLA